MSLILLVSLTSLRFRKICAYKLSKHLLRLSENGLS